MARTKDLVTKRKEAYDFIVRKVKSTVLLPQINSDRALAKALCRPEKQRDTDLIAEIELIYADLVSLKEGRGNPTQRLIDGVRSFFGQTVPEHEIQAYLITPFLNA